MDLSTKEQGFTLIELAIVLGIMVVAMALVMPQVEAVKDAYLRGALAGSLQDWAERARQTNAAMVKYEACASGDDCTFMKTVAGNFCPSTAHPVHRYADHGTCLYNLHDSRDRAHLDLPNRNFSNIQNGQPLYLLHGDSSVAALTCIDAAFGSIFGQGSFGSAYVSGHSLDCPNGTVETSYTIPALSEHAAKSLARRARYHVAAQVGPLP